MESFYQLIQTKWPTVLSVFYLTTPILFMWIWTMIDDHGLAILYLVEGSTYPNYCTTTSLSESPQSLDLGHNSLLSCHAFFTVYRNVPSVSGILQPSILSILYVHESTDAMTIHAIAIAPLLMKSTLYKTYKTGKKGSSWLVTP